ncbi:hypothetical protein Tco_1418413 [Tanacetum coccineum]
MTSLPPPPPPPPPPPSETTENDVVSDDEDVKFTLMSNSSGDSVESACDVNWARNADVALKDVILSILTSHNKFDGSECSFSLAKLNQVKFKYELKDLLKGFSDQVQEKVQTAKTRKNPGKRFITCSKCNVYDFLNDDLPSEYYKELLYGMLQKHKQLKKHVDYEQVINVLAMDKSRLEEELRATQSKMKLYDRCYGNNVMV